jgi:citrate lyase beta subunit
VNSPRRKVRRSVLEVPTMDQHKWEKIPSIPADVFFVDMEDSVPPNLKEVARDKVAAAITTPEHFGGREVFCRVNNLATEWGRADIEAMAEVRAPVIVYPKIVDPDDLVELDRLLTARGVTPEVIVLIETPQAVLHLEEIAKGPRVQGLFLGQGDLSMTSGIALLDGDRLFAEGFVYARSKMIMAARAYNLTTMEGVFVRDLRDVDAVKASVRASMSFGFSSLLTFYPPHVPIINEMLTPTADELKWHRRVVEAYSEAVDRGLAAVSVDGRWLTIHQYTNSTRALELAEELGVN